MTRNFSSFKLQKQLQVIGKGQHRSGWPAVMQALDKYHSPDGIILDDFVDRSFSYERLKQPYLEPWVGFFHNPHNMPAWFDPRQVPLLLFRDKLFVQSYPHLKLAFTLSRYLAEWLEVLLDVPVIPLKFAMSTPDMCWSEEAFLKNRMPKVIQIGWWLRNLEAIYQLGPVQGFQKARLMQPYLWVVEAEKRCRKFWSEYSDRKRRGKVNELPLADIVSYDKLLSKNIVFLELFDTSANNVVVECLVRNTPLVVNRHPAIEEYFGVDYPLFYDSLEEASNLITRGNVIEAHHYLKQIDKSDLNMDLFVERVKNEIRAL